LSNSIWRGKREINICRNKWEDSSKVVMPHLLQLSWHLVLLNLEHYQMLP